MKTVLITGILGQDGSNLAEYLINNTNNLIVGVTRRGSNPNIQNISKFMNHDRFKLESGDITDQSSLDSIVSKYLPDYFINFAANSFVGTSWGTPEQVINVNTIGVLKGLESIRKINPKCRYYSAGSSEEYGKIIYTPQNDDHPLIPVSPYAVSKVAARHLVSVYRESYGLFAIHGTLYNHEGPKRGSEFVTRKVSKNIAKILNSIESNNPIPSFKLGNIFTKKDWSDSRDMVKGVWLMLNNSLPKEYILSSGKTRTIADMVKIAFDQFNIKGNWVFHSNQLEDYFMINVNGKNHKVVTIDANLFRPTEVGIQIGDSSKAREELGWNPEISFEQMIKEMVENDRNIVC